MAAVWSEDEVARLVEWTPRVPPETIAVRLKRPAKTILRKQKQLGLLNEGK